MIGTTKYRPMATAATVAVFALLTVAALGLWGRWTPTAAAAEAVLGVDADTAVALGPEVTTAEKFESAAATQAPAALGLIAPTAKVVAELDPLRLGPVPLARHVGDKRLFRGKWRSARVSWYGPGFYGNGMAGGGKLRRNSMVVAHRSMKFGTRILFKYKGRAVVAVVKDRGPFIAGRTFDLGPGTAKALRFNGVGTVKYRILH